MANDILGCFLMWEETATYYYTRGPKKPTNHPHFRLARVKSTSPPKNLFQRWVRVERRLSPYKGRLRLTPTGSAHRKECDAS